MRLGPEHHELLLSFAQKHPAIITNQWIGLSGYNNSKKLWELLTNELNALGFGLLNTAEYKRRLTDWKSKTKDKAAQIKSDITGTGGGPSGDVKLSILEKRLLALMGNKSYEGDSVKELGLSCCQSKCNETATTSKQSLFHKAQLESPTTTKEYLVNPTTPTPVTTHTGFKVIKMSKPWQEDRGQVLVDYLDNVDENMPPVSEISNEVKTVEEQEHNYANIDTPKQSTQEKGRARSTERRRRINDLSSDIKDMNDETLSVLKHINTNLENINNSLSSINTSVTLLAQAVCNIVDKMM